MTFSAIIFNSRKKIRPVWRLILFLVITFAINIPLQMGLHTVLKQGIIRGMLSAFTYFLSAGLSLFIQIKYLDKSSFKKYGLRIHTTWIKEFLFGSLLSLIQLLLFFVIMYVTGNLKITGYFVKSSPDHSFLEGFLSETIVLLAGASIEELFFRAFLFYILFEVFQTILKDKKKRVVFAAVVSSVLFGLAHMGNTGATLVSNVNLMVDALLMALPFLITGRLGMSIGIHFAWNLIQGPVFGFAVSGNITQTTIIGVSMPDNLLTGGIFGPEGSILLGVLDLIAILLILYWKRAKKYETIINRGIIEM